jgi:hypothetical protein
MHLHGKPRTSVEEKFRSAAMQIPAIRHDDLMVLTPSGAKEAVLGLIYSS